MKLLDHLVSLCLIIGGSISLFSKASVPFYIPNAINEGFDVY